MDIRKLVNDTFSDRKNVGKSASSAEASGTSKASSTSETSLQSDKISISQTFSSDTIDLANRVYGKLNAESLDRVRSIKRSIENGQYDVDAALSKVTSRIASDLSSLDVVVTDVSLLSETRSVDTKQLLARLDDSMYRQIAEKLLGDIKSL